MSHPPAPRRAGAATEPAPLRLEDAVQFLPGVGPKKAELLARLGIATLGDLLQHFPARYERTEHRTIEHLEEGIIATIVGRITAVRQTFGRRGGGVSATLLDNTGRCGLRWFNAGWMMNRVQTGAVVQATGLVRRHGELAQLVNPRIVVLDRHAPPVDEKTPARLDGVYPATAELPSRSIARLIQSNLDRLLLVVEERHPPARLRDRSLIGLREALELLHRPTTDAALAQARRRVAYDELLLMQLAVALARQNRRVGPAAPALATTPEIDHRIRRRFHFPLTPGQNRAIREISADLAGTRPMHRLLQGDVGCGKTVVALYAALAAVANRRQAAIMAPTELLAEQHARSIERYLAGSRVRHALLSGGLSAARRREVVRQIGAGELDLVVGTHALIQEDVRFPRLGLVIVDEQHRFGVGQREMIRGKGPAPHYLVMTATPIPRTLAMTVFGDLDVSTIDGLPPGRSGIETRVFGPRAAGAGWDFVRGRVEAGEQAYVVYPLIDESDQSELRAATVEFTRLREQVFAGRRVGLLHGRMASAEREEIMRAFAAGELDVLAATTVIEVGIDVARATCMVIVHAERYGLSQLHQLRGRVGRGEKKGYCLLLTEDERAAENERLAALVRTCDGFRIAEEDLRLRGPGALLGTRQHGLPELQVADLAADMELLRICQRDAGELVRADPELKRPENHALRRALEARGEAMAPG